MLEKNLTHEDFELIEAAKEVIKNLYELDRHHVGAALRTKDGRVFTAVHIEAYVGRITVCAEAIVIGKAISEGYKDFDTIVAVRHPDPDDPNREIRIVSPCGMCRELLSDYGEEMNVILSVDDQIVKCPILDLIPLKYKR
jgi:cytidine deaminase